jgi:RES domain-containing protein
MLVYRICLAKYAEDLFASGRRARWNSKDRFVVYTAATRALACLENVVHRSGEGLNDQFRVLVIDIPDDLPIEEIKPAQLPAGWEKASSYSVCQPLGDAWYEQRQAAVLRVPSSIIPQESNYVLHTRHPDFKRIRIVAWEEFSFDNRIKAEEPEG